jgi:hypothetical protein
VRIDETRDLSMEEKAARRKWKNAPMFDCLTELLKLQKSGQFHCFFFLSVFLF